MIFENTKILSSSSSYRCTSPRYHPGSQFVPSRSFSVQRTSTTVPTCVRKFGQSPQSFNFAGCFLFLSDFRTSLIFFCTPFEHLSPILSFFGIFVGFCSTTFNLDFSSSSNNLFSSVAKTISGSRFEEVASIVGGLLLSKS